MKRICAACGRYVETKPIGKAQVCADCAERVNALIKATREDGAPVNVAHVAKRLFVQRRLVHSGKPSIFVQDIPGELAGLLADRAAKMQMSEREIILSALWEYLKNEG